MGGSTATPEAFGDMLALSTTIGPNVTVSKADPLAAAMVARAAYCYVLPCVCVMGIVGNITNLIVLSSRRLRAVSYMYLRALAVADLFCMIFALMFVSVQIADEMGLKTHRFAIIRFYHCHFMLTLINWSIGTGVFIVVALTLERFISIVFPMHFRQWNSPQRAFKAIAMAFIIPFFLYLPYCIGRYQMSPRIVNETTNETVWVLGDTDAAKTKIWEVYKWTRESSLRFAPIIILCLLNINIMLAFRKRQKMFNQLTKRKDDRASKDDTLLYMLAGTVFMFFVCNIPAAINLLFINEELKKRLDYQVFRAVANILEISNHASQFYVFCACSTDYRTTFIAKFPCFEKSYSGRGAIRSIVKRTQSMITRERATDSEGRTTASPKSGPSTSGGGGGGGPGGAPGQQVRIIETDTMDVHLASCEDIDKDEIEKSEGERDSLLEKHNIIINPESNGGASTFL